jgi:hypothetical protein
VGGRVGAHITFNLPAYLDLPPHVKRLHDLAVRLCQPRVVQPNAKLQGVAQAGVLDEPQVLVQLLVCSSSSTGRRYRRQYRPQ